MGFTLPMSASANDVEMAFNKLKPSEDIPNLNELKDKIINLVGNNFVHKGFLDIIPIIEKINRQDYYQFLRRRDEYLKNNEGLSCDDFGSLFGNQKKSKNNSQVYSTGKYNKSELHQGWSGESVLVSSLEILKKTPFFETMIRCSLKRNKEKDGWVILIPLCNKEGQYKEIKDEEIEYLKKFNYVGIGSGIISNSSLGFNILESIFINEYLHKIHKLTFNRINELDYNTIREKINSRGIPTLGEGGVLDMFLGKDIINLSQGPLPSLKNGGNLKCDSMSEECLKQVLELSKTGIIKLLCTVKIPNNYYPGKSSTNQIKSTRGYIINQSGEDENFYYGTYHPRGDNLKLGRCFSPKGCNEWFFTGHQYSIEKTFTKGDETYVTIINPWFTEKKLNVTLKQFRYMIKCFDIITFNIDKMFVENEQ